MVLFRSAMKQIARRHGLSRELHVPAARRQYVFQRLASASVADGSAIRRQRLCLARRRAGALSARRAYLAGLLAHARAAAAFTTPTVNGYKRYQPYSLAPDRAIWARDNRGVMIRVMGEPGDPATHLENRVGEPAANPYLYMASQIYAGLDGIDRKLVPGPSADTPYEMQAEPLPKTLAEAVAALREDKVFYEAFGAAFIDYFIKLKDAEIARFRQEAKDGDPDITPWEAREYFDLF